MALRKDHFDPQQGLADSQMFGDPNLGNSGYRNSSGRILEIGVSEIQGGNGRVPSRPGGPSVIATWMVGARSRGDRQSRQAKLASTWSDYRPLREAMDDRRMASKAVWNVPPQTRLRM